MNPFLVLAVLLLVGAAGCLFMLVSISKVIKEQRRFDGHDHAKVVKICQKEHLPGTVATAAGVGSLNGLANPGNEYVVVAFDPEPRVHIETTTSFGMPKGFFNGVETVEIQYDLNNPTKIYLCDERAILARQSLFKVLAIALGLMGLLALLMVL